MLKKFNLLPLGLAAVMLLSACSAAANGSTAAAGSANTANTVNTQTEAQTEAAQTGTANSSQAAAGDDGILSIIEDIPTTQYFTDEAVPDDVITKILTAGINSPSGMNNQPWHFTVVTDKTVLNQINEDMSAGRPAGAAASTKAGIADAPAVIFIYAGDDGEFDAGLACENMCVMANALGYGTKIVSSPKIALDDDRKEDQYNQTLGVPYDMEFEAAILLGKADESVDTTVDGYTGATERNAFDSFVTYVK